METIELRAEPRRATGKGNARRMRRAGRIPAVLYGRKRDTVGVTLDAKDFEARVASLEGSHLVRLQSQEPEIGGCLALVKEVQRDPLTGNLVHADLYEVDVDTKIRVNVPLHFVGKSSGVEMGGILQPIRRELAVLCLPTDIPEFIEVDVSALGINEALHLNQVSIPSGIDVQLDGQVPLVTVLPPVVEEVKVEAAEAVVEGAPAPETGSGETGKS
jgi:large subunit ribosomal protein L25